MILTAHNRPYLKGKSRLQLNLNLDIFKPKAPPLFGMDISSSSVKLVELADAGRGNPRVERYAIEALPKDAVLDGNITNLDAVVDAVQRGWKRIATRTKNVALALPTAAVITKKIIVPAGPPPAKARAPSRNEGQSVITVPAHGGYPGTYVVVASPSSS